MGIALCAQSMASILFLAHSQQSDGRILLSILGKISSIVFGRFEGHWMDYGAVARQNVLSFCHFLFVCHSFFVRHIVAVQGKMTQFNTMT